MGMMMNIQMDSDDMIEALVERVRHWTDDSDVVELFEQYYEHMVESYCFSGREFNVMSIVDNDYVNNTSVTYRKEYNKAREEFLRDNIKSYIEKNKDTYNEDEHADWVTDLTSHIEDLKEEAPEWDDIECGENNIEFLDGYYIEAKTDSCLLITW